MLAYSANPNGSVAASLFNHPSDPEFARCEDRPTAPISISIATRHIPAHIYQPQSLVPGLSCHSVLVTTFSSLSKSQSTSLSLSLSSWCMTTSHQHIIDLVIGQSNLLVIPYCRIDYCYCCRCQRPLQRPPSSPPLWIMIAS